MGVNVVDVFLGSQRVTVDNGDHNFVEVDRLRHRVFPGPYTECYVGRLPWRLVLAQNVEGIGNMPEF